MTRYLLPILLIATATLLVGAPVALSVGACVLLARGGAR